MGQSAGSKQEKDQLARNQQQQQEAMAGQNASLAEFGKQLGSANEYVKGMSGSIDKSQKSLDQQQADIDPLKQSVDQQDRSVDLQQEAIDPLTQSVNQQQGTVNQQQGQVNKQQGYVDQLGAHPGYSDAEVAAMKANAAGQTHAAYGGAIDQIKQGSANAGGNVGQYTQLGQLAQNRAIAANSGATNIDTRAADAALQEREALPGQQAGVVNSQGQVVQGQQGVTQGRAGVVGAQQGVTAGRQGVTQGRQGVVSADQGVTAGQSQITHDLGSQASLQQGNASLAYKPVDTYSGEYNQLGSNNTSLINGMPKQSFLQQLALQGMQSAGQVGAAAAGKP